MTIDDPRRCVHLTALAILLVACAALSGAPAAADDQRGGATGVGAFMPAALAEVSPGLCFADTPLCTNALQDQVHIYSQACSATGTFEGRQLSPTEPCGIDLTAFMNPSLGFSTPNCATTQTQTSDKARAFGRPVNAVTIGGVRRKLDLSYPFAVLSSRTATGWLDGPDRDQKPAGDHRLIFSIQVRPHEGSPPMCITEPFTGGDVTAVMHISDWRSREGS
jgi:hypothetical protein